MLTVYQGKSKSLRTEILHQRRKDLNARFENDMAAAEPCGPSDD